MKITPLTLVQTINDLAMLQAALTPLWMQWQATGTPPTQDEIDAAAARTEQGAQLLAEAIARRREREMREQAQVIAKS
jgi:hypothetical protein